MSVSAGEVLDRATEHLTLRERRAHATRAVADKLRTLHAVLTRLIEEGVSDSAFTEQDESWVQLAEAINTAGEAKDEEKMRELVMMGFRRILIERDPKTAEIRIPKTQQEWDRLPDVLPEFERRYRMAE